MKEPPLHDFIATGRQIPTGIQYEPLEVGAFTLVVGGSMEFNRISISIPK